MFSLRFDQCLKVFDKLANKSSPFMMPRTQQHNGTHLTVIVFTSFITTKQKSVWPHMYLH